MALSARLLILICSTSACWAFSWGLGTQVVTHWLKSLDCTDTVIGLAHSFYYFGVAAGSFAVPSLTRRFGPAHCATFGMIATGMTIATFPLGSEPATWYLLRFLTGVASALSLVPLETIVSRESTPEKKTTNFAFYGVSLTVGGALGIGVGLDVFGPGDVMAFLVGAAIPAGAGVSLGIGMWRIPRPAMRIEDTSELGWIGSFLSYGTAWFQGFLEGGMISFLSLFLIARGFSSEMAGVLMGATMIGVIVFQVPVGWLADRWGKAPLLLSCYGVVALGLLAIPTLSHAVALAASLFVFGACTGAMYPLGLSLLGDRLPDSALPRAYAWYLAIECIGSQAGAAAMGYARDWWGGEAMFAVGLAALVAVLTAWLGLRQIHGHLTRSTARAVSEHQRQAA
ncbi:MAG TPA: MFS transporter [Gemmataceae bacterium]|nr:MFS transporter [Gemmataceae bacterium]